MWVKDTTTEGGRKKFGVTFFHCPLRLYTLIQSRLTRFSNPNRDMVRDVAHAGNGFLISGS